MLNGIRRHQFARKLSPLEATLLIERYLKARVNFYPMHPFAARIWKLRHEITPYDAAYVALAESLKATLWTADRRLAGATASLIPTHCFGQPE